MKNIKLFVGASLIAVTAGFGTVQAGLEGSIGNGGGAWICQNMDHYGTLRWAKFVDLYEGRKEFGLDIPEVKNRDAAEIIESVLVRRVFPVSENLYRALNEEMESVKANLVRVDADLHGVDDALFRILPPKGECLDGGISYAQIANYTNYGKILIQKRVYEAPQFSETDKAALLMHEAVYAYLRKQMGDKNSVRARRVVGLLFSTLTRDALKKEVEKQLGGSLDTAPMDCPEARCGGRRLTQMNGTVFKSMSNYCNNLQ